MAYPQPQHEESSGSPSHAPEDLMPEVDEIGYGCGPRDAHTENGHRHDTTDEQQDWEFRGETDIPQHILSLYNLKMKAYKMKACMPWTRRCRGTLALLQQVLP